MLTVSPETKRRYYPPDKRVLIKQTSCSPFYLLFRLPPFHLNSLIPEVFVRKRGSVYFRSIQPTFTICASLANVLKADCIQTVCPLLPHFWPQNCITLVPFMVGFHVPVPCGNKVKWAITYSGE
ncbi:hypothetical protein BaRGS_00038983 [Batillaria attramentaria]|uniref:Uncharacterized protein n=1 Tax=Batillaria attramentaria TaxID=370345 RepID=A0ABD0J486_9CAEN